MKLWLAVVLVGCGSSGRNVVTAYCDLIPSCPNIYGGAQADCEEELTALVTHDQGAAAKCLDCIAGEAAECGGDCDCADFQQELDARGGTCAIGSAAPQTSTTTTVDFFSDTGGMTLFIEPKGCVPTDKISGVFSSVLDPMQAFDGTQVDCDRAIIDGNSCNKPALSGSFTLDFDADGHRHVHGTCTCPSQFAPFSFDIPMALRVH